MRFENRERESDGACEPASYTATEEGSEIEVAEVHRSERHENDVFTRIQR
jgi:hypothetical protein